MMSWMKFGIGLTAAVSALVLHPADAQPPVGLPSNPQATCIFTPAAFAAMYQGGTVTLNGAVVPANSLNNPGNLPAVNCPFFQWSDQMFLWLTSPVSGGGGPMVRTLFSPAFYQVSEPDSSGRRTFVRNDPNKPLRMGLRVPKPVENRHNAVRARSGQPLALDPGTRHERGAPLIRLLRGGTARAATAVRTASGDVRLLDSAGRVLNARKAVLPPPQRMTIRGPGCQSPVTPPIQPIAARRFVVRGVPVYLDRNNDVIDVAADSLKDTEEGQAGSNGVLISQNSANPGSNGSLVYYMISVNDLYAYHRTMQGGAQIQDPTNITFPTTQSDMNAVVAYAAANNLPPIAHPEALAIEAKSSWVEASTVADPQNYVQVRARVPVYYQLSSKIWLPCPNQERETLLVMVGLHVVGSTFEHGEMVWATYEHSGNSGNAAYSYNSSKGLTVNVPQDSTGPWLFTPSPVPGATNVQKATWGPSSGIIAGSPIAFSPVLRLAPWGSPAGLGSAGVNTMIISLNNSRIGQMPAEDVRSNYLLHGAIWTNGGVAPSQPNPPAPGNLLGSLQLANSTMETFVQGPVTQTTGTNCFSCHQSNAQTPPQATPVVTISHVYGDMYPLKP
jgi:hypothetical protein